MPPNGQHRCSSAASRLTGGCAMELYHYALLTADPMIVIKRKLVEDEEGPPKSSLKLGFSLQNTEIFLSILVVVGRDPTLLKNTC
ncbi:hypothetical protein TSMEX_005844 [Taenia solium]|eukprot:TsM_000895200 transcript=TsM_000895200 gene=TsM_000895200